jgi:APA family basic amino acid/polyamine antiporter
VAAGLGGGTAEASRLVPSQAGPRDVLQSAGLLFFAFAGYARIATLGEEVRDPARTIPRAVRLALAGALAVYALVAVAALAALGPAELAGSSAPLVDVVRAGRLSGLAPVVAAGGALAALGVLLSLLVGVSRTALAMAREGDLPRALAAVSARTQVPHRAELAVAAAVVVLVLALDLRDAVGFSSLAVLVYYAVANAAALTLPGGRRVRPAAGLVGCVVLVGTLPPASVVTGLAVLAAAALARAVGARAGGRL